MPEPLRIVTLTVMLRAFGKHGCAVKVEEPNPETSPGELTVEVWKYAPAGIGGNRMVFAHAKRQPDGDVIAALRFIQERWMPEVTW